MSMSRSGPVRVAVVGAGMMGANHARVIRQIPDAELVAVVDGDMERAAVVAGQDAQAYSCVECLPSDIDLAILCVPTVLHHQVALELFDRKFNVLVEKPIAASEKQANEIVEAARQAKRLLAVGHIERFNPAVADLSRFLDHPLHIEADRVSPFVARIEQGVILDLMIHDIDIVLSLVGEDPVEAVTCSHRTVRSETEDLAVANLTFQSGFTATLTASRLGQKKRRTLEVTQMESVIEADLIRQDISIHRMTRVEYLAEDGARYRTSSVLEVPFLESRGEPLALELSNVVHCVRTGAEPKVNGRAGVRALAVAEELQAALR